MFNEVHSSHGHTLLLITKPSLQATALLQHLKQSLAITGKLHNIQRSLEDISAGCIVLMDMMEADKKLIHYWQDNLSRKNNNIKTLLLNTPDDYPYREIENWPHINGVFYATEDQEHVVSGLQGILRGECYFFTKISQLPDYALRKLPLQQHRVRITHSSRKKRSSISYVLVPLIMKSRGRYLSARIRLRHIFIIFSKR